MRVLGTSTMICESGWWGQMGGWGLSSFWNGARSKPDTSVASQNCSCWTEMECLALPSLRYVHMQWCAHAMCSRLVIRHIANLPSTSRRSGQEPGNQTDTSCSFWKTNRPWSKPTGCVWLDYRWFTSGCAARNGLDEPSAGVGLPHSPYI